MSAPAPTEPRTWTIEMPAGIRLLNANDRQHWGQHYQVTRRLRQTAGWLAKAAKIPPLEHVRIVVEYQPPTTSRKRDSGNWAPTGKACIDGIRDARVIADDDSTRLVSEEYVIGKPFPRGRIVIHVTEVTDVPSGAGIPGGTA